MKSLRLLTQAASEGRSATYVFVCDRRKSGGGKDHRVVPLYRYALEEGTNIQYYKYIS